MTYSFPEPKPASELADGEDVVWLVLGYLGVGLSTLLVALFKTGKTVLLSRLLLAFTKGFDWLAVKIKKGTKVLVVSEESEKTWRRRVERLGIGDNVTFLCRPFHYRPNAHEWEAFVEYVAEKVRESGIEVVIFDTIEGCWPCIDENDSNVTAALLPLFEIMEHAAVLLVHQSRARAGATDECTSRGTTALPAFCDVLLTLRKYSKANDPRRKLLIQNRHADLAVEDIVIELEGDRYTVAGTKADATFGDKMTAIRDLLPPHEPGLTPLEVRAAWNGEIPRPAEKTLEGLLRVGWEAKKWKRHGEGKRGNPLRYFSSTPQSGGER